MLGARERGLAGIDPVQPAIHPLGERDDIVGVGERVAALVLPIFAPRAHAIVGLRDQIGGVQHIEPGERLDPAIVEPPGGLLPAAPAKFEAIAGLGIAELLASEETAINDIGDRRLTIGGERGLARLAPQPLRVGSLSAVIELPLKCRLRPNRCLASSKLAV